MKKCPWISYLVKEEVQHSDCIHDEIRDKNKCLYCLLNILLIRLEKIEECMRNIKTI